MREFRDATLSGVMTERPLLLVAESEAIIYGGSRILRRRVVIDVIVE